MIPKFILIPVFIFVLVLPAFAETSIKAEVDKRSLTTDELLTYKISIVSSEKKLPPLTLPKLEGFEIVSSAQSTTMSYAKEVHTFIAITVILVPTATGKIKILPSSIVVHGKTYSTESFEIEVLPGKTKPAVPKKEKSDFPLPSEQGSEKPKVTL
ncbi:MAG: BatD family protein [Candidatus Omnitrophica bacterium]|nr:BatD family protein [Candidatus Omnitrophota bacterium]